MKKAGILIKINKQTSSFNNNLVNNIFFNNKEYNTNIISSVISREEDKSLKPTLDYIFKEVPHNAYKNLTSTYIKGYNEILIDLIDKERFNYFKKIISTHTTTKSYCKIQLSSTIRSREKELYLAPLEIFFYNSKLHILFIEKKSNKLKYYEGNQILSAAIQNETCTTYISEKEIEKEIDKITIGSENNQTSVVIWLKPELLNKLHDLELIKDIEILKKQQFQAVVHKSETYYTNFENEIKTKTIDPNLVTFQNFEDYYIYKVKITTDKHSLLLILKLYSNEIKIDNIKPVSKIIKNFIKDCKNKNHNVYISILKVIIYTLVISYIIFKT